MANQQPSKSRWSTFTNSVRSGASRISSGARQAIWGKTPVNFNNPRFRQSTSQPLRNNGFRTAAERRRAQEEASRAAASAPPVVREAFIEPSTATNHMKIKVLPKVETSSTRRPVGNNFITPVRKVSQTPSTPLTFAQGYTPSFSSGASSTDTHNNTFINSNGRIIAPNAPYWIENKSGRVLIEGFPNIPSVKVYSKEEISLLDKLKACYQKIKPLIGNYTGQILHHKDIIEFLQTLLQYFIYRGYDGLEMNRVEFFRRMNVIFFRHRLSTAEFSKRLMILMNQISMPPTIIAELLRLYDTIPPELVPNLYPPIPTHRVNSVQSVRRGKGSGPRHGGFSKNKRKQSKKINKKK